MKKNDRLLIGAVLLIALLMMAGMRITKIQTPKGGIAVVTVDGTVYGQYPLDKETEEKIVKPDGSYNVLVIRDGKADVTDASCPDKICVDQKAADRNGESIVCLPNKVVIAIEQGEESDLDTVTG